MSWPLLSSSTKTAPGYGIDAMRFLVIIALVLCSCISDREFPPPPAMGVEQEDAIPLLRQRIPDKVKVRHGLIAITTATGTDMVPAVDYSISCGRFGVYLQFGKEERVIDLIDAREMRLDADAAASACVEAAALMREVVRDARPF